MFRFEPRPLVGGNRPNHHLLERHLSRFAVIGASSGTGLQIVRLLASRGVPVRAISRRPPPSSEFVESFSADVTDARSLAAALNGNFTAVFYTVDIHQKFAPEQAVRAAMVDGCVNSIEAVRRLKSPPRFVLLSVIGPDKSSWVWAVLGAMKRGMKRNIIDREQALMQSGLPYVIVRAPKLNDNDGPTPSTAATRPQHRLDMKRTIARRDLAQALVDAAEHAPANSIWDVFAQEGGPVPSWLHARGRAVVAA